MKAVAGAEPETLPSTSVPGLPLPPAERRTELNAAPGRGEAAMNNLPTGTVSFLFTDIEGSTALLHRPGDQRYTELLEAHRRILRDAIGRNQEALR